MSGGWSPAEPGTHEADWLDWWRRSGPWSRLDPAPGAGDRVVLVAPHPDDEVVAVGGLCAAAARRGADVQVLALTDGEGSHPGSPTTGPDELVALRRAETSEACAVLGLAEPHRAGLPDGGLASRVDAVAAEIAGLVGGAGAGCTVLAPWTGDDHPDHEAAGLAAREVCRSVGARLLEYPVWTWHWARTGDPRVPWHRAAVVDLDPGALAAKREAIARFRSQVHPLSDDPRDAAILPPWVRVRFERPFEVVFTPEHTTGGPP